MTFSQRGPHLSCFNLSLTSTSNSCGRSVFLSGIVFRLKSLSGANVYEIVHVKDKMLSFYGKLYIWESFKMEIKVLLSVIIKRNTRLSLLLIRNMNVYDELINWTGPDAATCVLTGWPIESSVIIELRWITTFHITLDFRILRPESCQWISPAPPAFSTIFQAKVASVNASCMLFTFINCWLSDGSQTRRILKKTSFVLNVTTNVHVTTNQPVPNRSFYNCWSIDHEWYHFDRLNLVNRACDWTTALVFQVVTCTRCQVVATTILKAFLIGKFASWIQNRAVITVSA